MSHSVFAVYLPDRQAPILVEAERFVPLGCEMVLTEGEEFIARTSDRGFVVRQDCVREAGTEIVSDRPAIYAEPLVAGAVAEFSPRPAPIWPLLAGISLGLLAAAALWALRI